MAVLLLGMAPAIAAGGTIYVDADASAGGNGTSWGTAYKYLQDALYKPPTGGDEIWVAQGTYKPDENTANPGGTGSRTATFQLINGVAIYGGYAGFGEPDPNARDVELYETILSGNIGSIPNKWDNSYHVITGSGTDANTILDGFIIREGSPTGDWPNNCGGGIYDCNATIVDCRVVNNGVNTSGTRGGGLAYCSGLISNCNISGNIAHYYGGGLYNCNGTISNCVISNNDCENFGGGLAICNAAIRNCVISSNGQNICNYGGGLYGCKGTVENCIISENSAYAGGGVAGFEGEITDCIISGNRAKHAYLLGHGGGLECLRGAIINCVIKGNKADHNGGGLFDVIGQITNCIITGNEAGEFGGGAACCTSSVTNCTFSKNSAKQAGGAVYSQLGRDFILNNCILWADFAPQGAELASGNGKPSRIIISYSDVQGGEAACYDPYEMIEWNEGNIDTDPLFVDIANGDYHLLVDSPCIDAGDNAALPPDSADLDGDGDTTEPIPFDLDGNPRIVNGIVDMGAFEAPLLDPVQLLVDLAQTVIDLNLQHGIENSLDGKLDAALNALEDVNQNNDVAAINTLEAFINAVEAQRGNKIPEAEADALIADVLQIIDLLSSD